jgi:hypothetical protein
MAKTEKKTDKFASLYPNITEWVLGGGWIEIGQSGGLRSLVRALDEGGMVWEGKIKYRTMDEALQALKNGIAEWTGENC